MAWVRIRCGLQAIWLVMHDYPTVEFHSNRQSRVTHPPIDIEIWQGSRVTQAFVEPPEHHTGLKIACKTQKSNKRAKIFVSMSKISLMSRQILAVVEMSNWFFGSRVKPSVDLNEILQYIIVDHC
jgi:hypothetical protein